MKQNLFIAIIFCVVFSAGAMELVGSYSGFTNTQKCVPNGDYLYLLDRFTLYVFDISTPSSPAKVDSIVFSGYVLDLTISGDYAFLGAGNSVVALDVSDPAHPVELGSTSFGASDYVYGIAYKDGYVYASIMNSFRILSYTPPATFSEVYSSSYMTKTVDVEGDYAAIGVFGGGGGGIFIFDISNPELPVGVGGMATPGFAVDVDIDGDRIYIADGAEVGVGTGHIFLMLTSDLHSEAGRFSSDDGDCQHGCAYGTQYIVANGSDGFLLLDWSEPVPTSPTIADEYSIPTTDYAQEVNVQYPYIYGITRNELLILYSDELVDTGTAVDTVDTIPPTVELVEPFDGAVSSCIDQCVSFVITDDVSGVDWSSVQIGIGADVYSIGDLYHSGDTVTFFPMIEWMDGDTVEFYCVYAADNDGNIAVDLPSGTFFTDFSPPIVADFVPAEWGTVSVDTPTISARIYDEVSSVNDNSISLIVNGTHIEPDDFDWDGSHITYRPTEPIVDTVVAVCISASDTVDYCASNFVDTCWTFFIQTDEISEKNTPKTLSLITYPNPFNSSIVIFVETQNLAFLPEIAIYDLRGNVVATPYSDGKPSSFVPLDKRDSEIAKQSSRGFVWTPDENVPSGIYLVRATIPQQKKTVVCTKRIVYLK